MKVLTLQKSLELPSSQMGTLFQRETSVCKNNHNNGVSRADIFHKQHVRGQPALLCRVTLGKSLNSFGFCLMGNWSCEQHLCLPSWTRRAPVSFL